MFNAPTKIKHRAQTINQNVPCVVHGLALREHTTGTDEKGFLSDPKSEMGGKTHKSQKIWYLLGRSQGREENGPEKEKHKTKQQRRKKEMKTPERQSCARQKMF